MIDPPPKFAPQQITTLKRPLTRRLGRLIVRVSEAGIDIRGKHRRNWHRLTWAQVASLAADEGVLLKINDEVAGQEVLQRMGITHLSNEPPTENRIDSPREIQ